MLGWMINRGLDGGRDAPDAADDTQMELPDTPGPVFAARAFKSALFGTPARPDTVDRRPVDKGAAAATAAKTTATAKDTAPAADDSKDAAVSATPARLPGILLTPGTATARRKRVSFGHEVGQKSTHSNGNDNGNDRKKSGFRIDRSGRRPNLFGDVRSSKSGRATTGAKLETVVEKSSADRADETAKPETKDDRQDNDNNDKNDDNDDNDDPWEEVDNDDNAAWDPDVTVDLNEPHSQSGRYWKAQFQRYQEDARAEMSKLLKYKQLAKSYAKMKDAEAGQLQAKLREEKDKVAQMEARITELAGQIARTRMKGSDRDYQQLITDLTRQTALAVQYRNQVKELEAMLQGEHARDHTRDHADDPLSSHPTAGSPRMQRTLADSQRDLRRARDQARELRQAKDEIRRLKSQLRAAEQRALRGASDSKEQASAAAAVKAAEVRTQSLEKRATLAEDERRRKDEELRMLQRKYDALKDDAKARVGEAEQVLRRKNEQIAELKKKVREAAAAAVHNRIDNEAEVDDGMARRPITSTSLAALERITRSRYESLSSKRIQEQTANRDDLHDSLHDDLLDDGFPPEPKLPQQKLSRHKPAKPDQQLVPVLEDEDAGRPVAARRPPAPLTTAKAPTTTSVRSTRATARKVLDTDAENDDPHKHKDEPDVDDVAANAAQLRRHRAAEPLRPIDPQQLAALPTRTASKVGGGQSRGTAAAAKAAVFCKHHYRAEEDDEGSVDGVAAAAAAAADASRLSLSSERAAAAVARIEKRRAERKRELALLRNKENLQPA